MATKTRKLRTPADPPRRPRRRPAGAGAVGLIRFLAWCVHLYTALGLVAAAAIAVLLVQGGAAAFRWSFVVMLAATLVDATDGTLARAIGIKKVLPQFDGRKLDDLTDFLTYTFLPLLLIWRAALLPPGWDYLLLLPLLASAYGFCQLEAKTDDGYFLGFPSLWNVVAFYLYVLQLPGWLAAAVVTLLSLLTFIPIRYLYPSQAGRLNTFCNVLGAVWACLIVVILSQLPTGSERTPAIRGVTWNLALISLYYPAFYMAASWAVTLARWRKQRRPIH
jgi:phosphatidylcholine synthase